MATDRPAVELADVSLAAGAGSLEAKDDSADLSLDEAEIGRSRSRTFQLEHLRQTSFRRGTVVEKKSGSAAGLRFDEASNEESTGGSGGTAKPQQVVVGRQRATSTFSFGDQGDHIGGHLTASREGADGDSEPESFRLGAAKEPKETAAKKAAANDDKLGTMQGVFLPCLQNILGVILFLRLPWITAQAGAVYASLIVVMCAASTLLTALSMSALATNGKVQAGGPYYVISRNLGADLGGAIGLIFYLGTTIASSMYVLGAVEALATGFDITWPFPFMQQLVQLAVMFALASLVSVGVKYVNMSSPVFLGIVLLSIFCFFVSSLACAAGLYQGALEANDFVPMDNMGPKWEADVDTGETPNFLWCIGLFYPSVTGIMAGSNRSGVLKRPQESIPTGTIGAISVTTTLYLAVIWLFGCTMANDLLKEEKLVVTLVAWPHRSFVAIGIVMSCLGAALQSLTGAPRLLSAIALDGTLPILNGFAARGSDEPRRAVWLTWFIASLPCLAGNLDYVTPIVTMFFLLMYATVNAACFLLAMLHAPGFRPRFRYFNWLTALVGCVWCITLMLIIQWYMAIVAWVLAGVLFAYIHHQKIHKDWGDSVAGLRFQIARDQLLQLTHYSTFYHPKNWRPQLLVMCKIDALGNPHKQELLALATMMKKGNGLLMAIGLLKGDASTDYQKSAEAPTEVMRMHMHEEMLKGFPRVLLYEVSKSQALITAIQSAGTGALRPNAVMMGWPLTWAAEADPAKQQEHAEDYMRTVKAVIGCKKAMIVLKGGRQLLHFMNKHHDTVREQHHHFRHRPLLGQEKAAKAIPDGTIDVWWIVHDGGLLLLLPHLIHEHAAWKHCRVRLFSVITEYSEVESEEEFRLKIEDFLDEVRIDAEVFVVNFAQRDSLRSAYADTYNVRKDKDVFAQIDRRRGDERRGSRESPRRQSGRAGSTGSLGGPPSPLGLGGSPKAARKGTPRAGSGDGSQDFPDTPAGQPVPTPSPSNRASPPLSTSPSTSAARRKRRSSKRAGSLGDLFAGFEKTGVAAPPSKDKTIHISLGGKDGVDDDVSLRVAHAFNYEMTKNSKDAHLVVTNLPLMVGTDAVGFMKFVEVLTADLKTVILVRGSGVEVVTTFG